MIANLLKKFKFASSIQQMKAGGHVGLFPVLLTGCLCLGTCAEAKAVLQGDTSKPATSIFYPDERVDLTFRVTGMEPKQDGLKVEVRVCDQNDNLIVEHSLPVLADLNGNDEVCLNAAPSGKLGFYRVYAKLSDGSLLTAPWSTCHQGQMTYAIVRNPNSREKTDESYVWFEGMDKDLVGEPLHPDVYGGITGQWRHLEPHFPGEYSKDPASSKIKLSKIVNLLAGLNSEWSIADKNKHFKMENHVGGHYPALTTDGERAFDEFCRAFARNYRKQWADLKPRLYEVSSEYRWSENGSRTIQDIIRAYEIAYKAVKAEDPEGIVVGPGFGYYEPIMAVFFKAGLGKNIDAVSEHSYCGFPPERNGLIDRIRDAHAQIKAVCGKDLPVYSTEFGFATHGKQVFEEVQMHGIIRATLIFMGEGYGRVSNFFANDYPAEPGYGYQYNLSLEKNLKGYGAKKTSPKPVYPAYSALTYFLSNARTCGDITFLGDTAWGYAFQKKNGKVLLAVWDWSGNPRDVVLPVGKTEIEIADLMGNVKKCQCLKGNLGITLTEDPLYVLDVAPEIWGTNAVKIITVKNAIIHSVVGKQIVIDGKVNARDRQLDGTLIMIPDKRTGLEPSIKKITIEAGKSAPFSFAMTLPKKLPEGKYPFSLTFGEKENNIAAAGSIVAIKTPVDLLEAVPVTTNGQFGLSVKIKETSGNAVKGTMAVRIQGNPDGRATLPLVINPGETKVFNAFFDDFQVNCLMSSKAEITIAIDDGNMLKKTLDVNFLFAEYRPNMTIDGDFDDWNSIPLLKFDLTHQLGNGQTYGQVDHQGEWDSEGKIAVAWNDGYLMFLVDVNDDHFCMPPSDSRVWTRDSVQIALSGVYRYQKTENMLQDKQTEAYSEMTFSLTEKGPYAYRHVTFNQDLYPEGPISMSEVPLAVKTEPLPDHRTRLKYEIAIPWNYLNIGQPNSGKCVGWAATVNDWDVGKRGYAAFGAFNLKRPQEFGMICLTK